MRGERELGNDVQQRSQARADVGDVRLTVGPPKLQELVNSESDAATKDCNDAAWKGKEGKLLLKCLERV